jgi:phosphatidylserine/phosphatidylglycerophosphate/cardiolipin synthase-like enzyme
MRASNARDGLRVKAIAGTRVVMIALDYPEERTTNLLGFAIGRKLSGSNDRFEWLPTLKVFKSVVPNPRPALKGERPLYRTDKHPLQGFLWSDYEAEPDKRYVYRVVPMFGPAKALKRGTAVDVDVKTESEAQGTHRVFFNRGAIASQAFSREFDNRRPTPAELENVDHPETKWLSRGLLEACLRFIDGVPDGEALRVVAYEFTYKPVLDALRRALDRGVDVRIVYQDTSGKGEQPNETAIVRSRIPAKVGRRVVLFPRDPYGTGLPHNKFIVHLRDNKPIRVWTGSTNFTPSGFLGQTNVGHIVNDPAVAGTYLEYWKLLATDPDREAARAGVQELTPHPPNVVPANSTTVVFSPRDSSKLLTYYGQRIQDAVNCACLTAAFGVNDTLAERLASPDDILRFLLLEKPASDTLEAVLRAEPDVITAYGVPLGEMYEFKDGEATARREIEDFELDKWFLEEDHFRANNDGFVFFVHTKFLLIDPLSDDPLVCTGSANFSAKSLLENDENMLFVRGDTRVADIYATEFDRIFRHFQARDIMNELAAKGVKAQKPFLKGTSAWTKRHYAKGTFQCRRREMFFAEPQSSWADEAAKR